MPTVIQVKRGTASSWTSANTVLAAGEMGFETDTKKMKVGDGSTAWTSLAYTGSDGDITGVTAGTGLSGGGASGAVTLTNDMATTITAAGDIVIGTGSGTYDNLPIGTTAQILTADTTVSPYKVKWAAPTESGGWTNLVASTAFGAVASVNLSSISQSYKDLRIVITGWSSATGGGVQIAFNNSSDTGYGGLYVDYTGTFVVSRTNNARTYFRMGDSLYSTSSGDYVIEIPFYSRTNNRKFGQGLFQGQDGGSNADAAGIFNFSKTSTAAISSIILSTSGGNFDAGNYELWGKN